MAEVRLNAERRASTGKGPARRSRLNGKVPAVVYGHGMDPLSIEVDRRDFVTALQTDAGMNVLLDIHIDGERTLALTRELQRDPVRGTLLHADFVQVSRTEKVEVEVPVHLVGSAPGVGEGGVLEQPLNSLHVRALATEVPQHVEADISGLNIGDSLRVSGLTISGFEVLNDPESVVVTIAQPVSEEELEAMEAEAGVEHEEPSEVGAEDEVAPAEDEAATEGAEGAEGGEGEAS